MTEIMQNNLRSFPRNLKAISTELQRKCYGRKYGPCSITPEKST